MTLQDKITAASKYISNKEKQRVKSKARSELIRLEEVFKDSELTEQINCFKEKFSICEIVYKEILIEYLKHKGKSPANYLQISMSQAPYALSFAGYDFEYDFLNKLFGAETRQGKKSVKKLRDSLNHSLTTVVTTELSDRYDELNKLMDTFLNSIRLEEE